MSKHALVQNAKAQRTVRIKSEIGGAPPRHQNQKDDRSNSCGYIASLSPRWWLGSPLGKWKFSANVLCSRDGRKQYFATGRNSGSELFLLTFFRNVAPFYRPYALLVRTLGFLLHHDRSDLPMPRPSTVNVLPHHALCICLISYSQFKSNPCFQYSCRFQ
jgi:hypothetical protein